MESGSIVRQFWRRSIFCGYWNKYNESKWYWQWENDIFYKENIERIVRSLELVDGAKEYIDKLFNAILLLYPLVPLEKREDCSMKYWQEKRIYEMLFNMDINLDDTNKDFDLYKKNIALFIKELERFLDELIEFATLPRSIIYESLGGRYRQNNAKS